jgi:alpha-L-fucosidase
MGFPTSFFVLMLVACTTGFAAVPAVNRNTGVQCPSTLFTLYRDSLVGFSLTDFMADGSPNLEIINATLTSKWFEGSDFVQIVELIVNNTDTQYFLTEADALDVIVSSDNLDLVRSGGLLRLAPGQAAIVQVGVKNKAGIPRGNTCTATVTATWGKTQRDSQSVSSTISGKCGFGNYTADAADIAWHTTPEWFDDAKFGIFIHWGVYSAPAYGDVAPNESYAEWYTI